MAKHIRFINDHGETVFHGTDTFTRAAEKVFRERWGYQRYTLVRAGRFSCVISPHLGWDDNGKPLSEFIAGEYYPDAPVDGDGSIKPGSDIWDFHLAGRLNTIGGIMSRLYSHHPHYAAIMVDLKAELRYLLEADAKL